MSKVPGPCAPVPLPNGLEGVGPLSIGCPRRGTLKKASVEDRRGYAMPFYAMYNEMLSFAMICHAVSFCTLQCCAVWCYSILCYAMPFYAVLDNAMPKASKPYHAVL